MGLKDLPTFLPLNNPLHVGQDTSSIDPMGIQGCQVQQTNGSRHVKHKKQLLLRKDESKAQKILCCFVDLFKLFIRLKC